MKTKLLLTATGALAVAGAIGAYAHIAALNARTNALEARLARLEIEISGVKMVAANAAKAATTQRQTPAAFTVMPRAVVEQGALESRVEQLEEELRPHPELLPLAK